MLISTELCCEDANQEEVLIRREQQRAIWRIVFFAMQDMCDCERIILRQRLMCDVTDQKSTRDLACTLGYSIARVNRLQRALENKLRALLQHMNTG